MYIHLATNPFIVGSSSNSTSNNPFVAQQRPSPSLNEMKQAQIPPNNQPANNPFS